MRFFFSTPTLSSIHTFSLVTFANTLEVTTHINQFYHPENSGAECSFINGIKDNDVADIGILACAVDEDCVEDETSSLGGRCFKLVSEEGADVEFPRELAATSCTFANGTTGVKCSGYDACSYVDKSKVGCGSCNYQGACQLASASIGENSCNGFVACRNSLENVGDNSCNGKQSCDWFKGFLKFSIGDCVCNGYRACFYITEDILDYNNCTSPIAPSSSPTTGPSSSPTTSPSSSPTANPTVSPTTSPFSSPTISPTRSPTTSPSKSPTINPTTSPTTSPSSLPTMSPSVSPSKVPFGNGTAPCFPLSSTVKLQSLTGMTIQVFEVNVFSAGNNVASGKIATQSSTYKGKARFAADKAVDGHNDTFSHTNSLDKTSWWEVDLGEMFPVESVKIFNRWCGDPSDPMNCLNRLSHSALLLYNTKGEWVSTTLLGDMSGVAEYEYEFTNSTKYCNGP